MKGGIERALFHSQKVIGRALDVEHDAVAVEIAVLVEGFQHQQIERSLKIVFGHRWVDP